jgi:hypothetical protein
MAAALALAGHGRRSVRSGIAADRYRLKTERAGAVGGHADAHMAQAGRASPSSIPGPSMSSTCAKHGLRVTHAIDVAEFAVPARF